MPRRNVTRTFIAVLISLAVMPVCAGPTIDTLYVSESPRMNGRCELSFALSDIYPKPHVFPDNGDWGYNPFRYETTPDQGPAPSAPGVNVWADITRPDGTTVRVDGFWCVEYRYLGESKSGFDRIVPINHPQTGTAEHWHVRFIPPIPGHYSVTVHADDPDPTTPSSSASVSFVVGDVLPGNHGLLRVSGDGSRLEYADGTPYCQFGFDMPQGCGAVNDQPVIGGKSGLDALASVGGNYVRRWLVNTHREDIYRGISWHQADGESCDDTVARSGRRSVHISAGSDPVVAVNRSLIGCLPGRRYVSEIWFKAAPGSTGSVRMVVGEDDGSTERVRAGSWIAVGEEWKQAQLTITTGPETKWLHVKPEFSGGTGDIYLDDIDLRDVTPGSEVDYCMIQNPSFERWSPVELDVANLWRADYFLQACERLGIAAQLTLFDYRLWDAVGGFFTGFYGDTFWGDMSTDQWAESESVRQQKRLLRYVAARYGGYPSLGLWELTNEMSPDWSTCAHEWLKEISAYLRSADPAGGARPITNSFWSTPASVVGYEQIPTIPVSSAHYYIYTNTHPEMESRTPGWGIRRENVDGADFHSPPLAYHVTLSYDSVKPEVRLIEKTVGIHPGRMYKLRYWLKASEMTGDIPQVRVQCFRHNSLGEVVPEGCMEQLTTPPVEWSEREVSWTAGSTEADVNICFEVIRFQAGEIWFDDMRLMESDDGVNWCDLVYNSDLTLSVLDGDELTWALQTNERSCTWYNAGPNGTDRAWISGEFGLYAWSTDLGTWVCSPLADSDTTGIHSHNAVWAQTMVSGAANSPTYWFTERYMLGQAQAGYDVYTPTWKGVATFVGRLPFRSESQLISTDPYYSQVAGVQSSDPRIRIIGHKKMNEAYFWVSNVTNTWENRIERGSPAVPVTAFITIPGFQAGVYKIGNYDSYTGDLIGEKTVIAGANGVISVSVAELPTDTAFIITAGESCPAPPEDGARVDLWNVVVTSTRIDASGIWIESPNRSWGAEVTAPWGTECVRGDRVHIKGACSIQNGHRHLVVSEGEDDCFEVCGTGTELKPVGMRIRDFRAISMDPLQDGEIGQMNAGLLVTCWGRVTSAGFGRFLLNDGSIRDNVWVDFYYFTPLQEGDVAAVTGICTIYTQDFQLMRFLQPRDEMDVVILSD